MAQGQRKQPREADRQGVDGGHGVYIQREAKREDSMCLSSQRISVVSALGLDPEALLWNPVSPLVGPWACDLSLLGPLLSGKQAGLHTSAVTSQRTTSFSQSPWAQFQVQAELGCRVANLG